MGGVGEARPRLACVVVELHEAEDQVRGHQLELVRRVSDHVSFCALAGRGDVGVS